MRNDYVQCISPGGFHRMHYTDWGDPWARRVVVCVHGLTRNCRDFDTLAAVLSKDARVVCPDVAGRGQSDWLALKDSYNYPQYLSDMAVLLARVLAWPPAGRWLSRLAAFLRHRYGNRELLWVGTSMGGLIGMLLAAQPGSPIRRLVMNDVGPLIPRQALERIGNYVGKDPRFKTFEELKAYVKEVSRPFGPLTDEQWTHLTRSGARHHEDGSWGMCYDPGIGDAFRAGVPKDVDLWPYYEKTQCPTLVIRGAESDLLSRATADEMQSRGPRPRIVEFAGIGHAPMLMSDDQIAVVRDFLLAP
jgi:pimeloyl-ACP methyl ester carboxylesterase